MTVVPRYREDALPAEQRAVLALVGPVARELGFYLAGGTAVALRLGHRRSIDLDWFTSADALDPLELAASLREHLPAFEVEGTGAGALDGRLRGVRLTFLRYRYPLLAPPDDAGALRIATLEDLVCMKLAAAAGRGEKKDFFDIAAICDRAIPLSEALAMFRRKYGLASSGHVLMSLAHFDDAEADPDPVSLDGATWEGVKRRLVEWTRELSRP